MTKQIKKKQGLDRLRETAGFYVPVGKKNGKRDWEVTMEDGGGFTTKTQFEAEVISQLVQIRQQLKKLGARSDLDIFNDEEDKNETMPRLPRKANKK